LSYPRRPTRAAAGFTLVELLVVLSILIVLTTLLLPSLKHARELSRRAICLGNIRDLTHAALLYAADNDGYLPDGASVNDKLQSPLCPAANRARPGSPIFGGLRVLPSIGGLLLPYLKNDPHVWHCPDTPDSSEDYSNPKPWYALSGVDPFNGFSDGNPSGSPPVGPDRFIPSYHYLCDKEWYRNAVIGSPLLAPFRLQDWVVRNVAGLRIDRINPMGGGTTVVLFHDRDSSFHSEGPPLDANGNPTTIYQAPATLEWHYFDNFGYLDGHGEGHPYADVNGYLGSIHGPIRQSWYGVDFPSAFPSEYASP
jgi:type II secretory pathway pseudopilin PulG